MITLEQAVATARDTARGLFGENELKHLRVEEFDRTDNGNTWKITLGWVEASSRQVGFSMMGIAGLEAMPRVYKVFHIDAETGEVKSMKIRD